MKSSYKTIEELVVRIDERNSSNEAGVLLGVSIDKCFIPSVANTIGTDLTKYKLIRKDDFAVSLMQVSRDSRIPIARQTQYEVAMMSPAYPIFRVKNPNEILPEYLEMWFKRDEFDREAAFIAVGGVRGSMPWNEFAQMQVYVPNIKQQKKIVDVYRIVEDRIELKRKINDNLEATLSTLYKEFFTIPPSAELPFGWKIAPFSDIATVIMGQSPESEDCNNDGSGKPLLNGPTEFGFYSPRPVQWTTNSKKCCIDGDLLFCVRGSTTGRMNWANQTYAIGRGLAAIRHKTDSKLNWFIKAMIANSLQEILAAATGSTFPNVGKDLLNGFQVVIPDGNTLQKFSLQGHTISCLITENAKEIDALLILQKTLLSKLTI